MAWNMFGVIRMCNGSDNRPGPTQFRQAYRKATARRILTSPATANCEADGDNLLGILSSVARRVSQPASSVRVVYAAEEPWAVSEVLLDAAAENCLSYVAGYLTRISLESHNCEQCRSAMCRPERAIGSQRETLTAPKSFTGVGSSDVGSLLLPTDVFFDLDRECYVTTQVQVSTLLTDSGIARRTVSCVMQSCEANILYSPSYAVQGHC